MGTKIILTNFIGALIIFLVWFVSAYLSGWIYSKNGDPNKLVLGFNCVLLVCLFTAATLRSSIELGQLDQKMGITDIEPDISISMEYPINVENDKVYRNTRNPDVIIKNNGPVKAVSLSCNIKIFVYNTNKRNITQFIDQKFKGFEYTVASRILEAFDEVRQSSIGIHGENLLAVYVVEIIYYRNSDMKKFISKKYFFAEKDKIIEERDFKTDERHSQLIEQIQAFDPNSFGDSQYKVTAAAEKTWFLETEPTSLSKKNPNGSVSIVTPEEQSYDHEPGLPYLEIKPVRLTATGQYINEEKIVDDHIELKIGYEFHNAGDTTAIITKDGFELDTTLEPGQTKFNTFIFKVFRGKDNQRSLESFLNLIDTEERPLKLVFISYYRPSNDPNKVLKKSIHFEIGKKSIKMLKE